jgi:type VI secretion system protein ImpB
MKTSQLDSKERVNIFFKSKRKTDNTETELPFKLMVMGDFSRRETNEPFEKRDSVQVTRENFNSVLRGMEIKLDMMVDNHLDPENQAQIPIHLELSSLKDFEPDQLVDKVIQLKKLTELRRSLSKAKKLLNAHPELMTTLKKIKEYNDKPEQS